MFGTAQKQPLPRLSEHTLLTPQGKSRDFFASRTHPHIGKSPPAEAVPSSTETASVLLPCPRPAPDTTLPQPAAPTHAPPLRGHAQRHSPGHRITGTAAAPHARLKKRGLRSASAGQALFVHDFSLLFSSQATQCTKISLSRSAAPPKRTTSCFFHGLPSSCTSHLSYYSIYFFFFSSHFHILFSLSFILLSYFIRIRCNHANK